jgi:hypothetical protein
VASTTNPDLGRPGGADARHCRSLAATRVTIVARLSACPKLLRGIDERIRVFPEEGACRSDFGGVLEPVMLKFTQTVALSSFATAFIMLSAQAASASSLTPGQYDLGGSEEICLESDKTWYSTTYEDWSGRWIKKDKKLHIYGNWDDGEGNSLITISQLRSEPYKAFWFQWRDDSDYLKVYPGTMVSFVKAVCDPPALAKRRNVGGNPGE